MAIAGSSGNPLAPAIPTRETINPMSKGALPGLLVYSLTLPLSFLKFAENTGVLKVNLGVLMRAPKGKDVLTERLLTEANCFESLLSSCHPGV